MSMNKVIEDGIRDTNKERNLQSVDPSFYAKFKKEWDEVTEKLKKHYSENKKEHKSENENVVVMRYSANGIEFR